MATSFGMDAARAARRRGLRTVVLGMAVVAASVTSLVAVPAHADGLDAQQKKVAAAITDNQRQLDQDSAQLSRAQEALARSESDLKAAKAALAAARKQRTRAEIDDRVLQAAVTQAESTLAVTRVVVALGEQKLKQEQQIAGAVVRQTTQQDTPLLGVAVFVTNVTTADVNDQVQWSTTLFNTTQNQMDVLQTLQAQVQAAQQSQEAAQAEVDDAKAAAAAHLTQTRQAEARATKLEADVSARVRANQAAKHAFEEQLALDSVRQAALASEATSVEDKIRARIALLGAQDWASGPASGAFAFPVVGPITSPFGMRLHPITHRWSLHDGTDFGVPCGTPIRAPRAGVVAEEYFNAGYGNRLMLDHGIISGHFVTTGYNHAERYVVSVGQHVSAGQVIGFVGSTGYSTGCHLHLMVWQDGNVVNPMAHWF